MSCYFSSRFFAELEGGSHGSINCPELKELDLPKLGLYDVKLVLSILHVLRERSRVGILV